MEEVASSESIWQNGAFRCTGRRRTGRWRTAGKLSRGVPVRVCWTRGRLKRQAAFRLSFSRVRAGVMSRGAGGANRYREPQSCRRPRPRAMALPKPPMWVRTPWRTGSSAAQRSPFFATCSGVMAGVPFALPPQLPAWTL